MPMETPDLGNVRSPKLLATLLNCTPAQLHSLAVNPGYRTFTIPKSDGSPRLIEDPEPELKRVLGSLGNKLQDLYYPIRPQASHGFIKTPEGEDSYHIMSNANAHLGCNYLVNIDLDDFFHQVTTEKVLRIFESPTFRLNTATEELLSKLVCYHGRLPMGSPSSPPLSNFAMLLVDEELQNWSAAQRITYTRYVDDLSFSSKKPLGQKLVEEVTQLLDCHRFRPDPQKIKIMGKADLKEVTGIVLSKYGAQLPQAFFDDLNDAIRQVAYLGNTLLYLPPDVAYNCMKGLKQSLAGRLAMVGQVYGTGHTVYQNLSRQIQDLEQYMLKPPPPRWRYNGYQW